MALARFFTALTVGLHSIKISARLPSGSGRAGLTTKRRLASPGRPSPGRKSPMTSSPPA